MLKSIRPRWKTGRAEFHPPSDCSGTAGPLLPAPCLARLSQALASSLASVARGLGQASLEDYIRLVKEEHGVDSDSEEWKELERELREAVKSGPSISVACRQGSLSCAR